MALFRRDHGLSTVSRWIAGLAWFCLLSTAASAAPADAGPGGNAVAAQVTADAREPAATYVTALVEQAVPQLLATPAPQRLNELHRLFEENIDVPAIARFAMGRYWRLADEAERAEFVGLFLDLLVRTSYAGLADYKGEKLRVADTRPADEDEVLVRSAFSLQDGPSIQVDWRLRPDMGRFKIQDVVVEGISIRIALRDLFAAAIQERGGTVAALLAAMRELVQSPIRDAR